MSWRAVVEQGGQVGADLERVDWEATPLGPPHTWPDRLVNILRVVVTSRFSMWMAWGPELTFFCNDAYRRDTLGTKYPWALGRPASEVWGEIWDDVGPRIASVMDTGVATWDESLLLYPERSGYREETYHTFSYSPLADGEGRIVGMLCVVAEETDKVIAERRLRTLRDLAAELAGATEQDDICRRLARTLERAQIDLPFTLTYLYDAPWAGRAADRSGEARAQLVAATGLTAAWGPALAGAGAGTGRNAGWPSPAELEAPLLVEADRFPAPVRKLLASARSSRLPERALVVPLRAQPDLSPIGFFVAGLTPHRPADENLLSFVTLLTDQFDSAIKTVRALEAAQLRADTLAELDQAKTRFFSNISHEFRTPLTLILGPLERLRQAIAADGHLALAADVETMHANALRLSKLVTDVLDFSRLQAGKLAPAREPVDLCRFTRELAEMFRSAVEHAGLRYTVDCREVGVVPIDPSMWERIVLNLLSNALKFTFGGEIALSLSGDDQAITLQVRDTGVGIPDDELPHLFERFHRVERSQARSSEGTGIGLALVSELTALHGGAVAVDSAPDAGSTFTVTLPRERVDASAPESGAASTAAAAFLAETARWVNREIPAGAASGPPPGSAGLGLSPVGDGGGGDDGTIPPPAWLEPGPARSEDPAGAGTGADDARTGEILIVDDNADMRAYLQRLLTPLYRVRTAANGGDALAQIEARPPDLVVSDVMMPIVDGVELVRRIRSQPDGADLPVILLTAAASNTVAAEGFGVGADDYLVKPFTAENLLMRVAARLAAGHERRRRAALSELATAVAAQATPERVLATVHPFLAEWLKADVTSLAVTDERNGVVRMWHDPGLPGGVGERYRSGSLHSSSPVIAMIRAGEALMIGSREELEARYPEVVSDIRNAVISAALVTPLRTPTGALRGSLISTWREAQSLGEVDQQLHRAVAAVVTEAVGRLAASEQEHRFLVEFQERLLEVDHRSVEAVIDVRYQPARGSLVGGDWYDVTTLADGSLGVAIGDVVGSGLPAATTMSQLRSAARLAAMSSSDPAVVVTMLDAFAARTPAAHCASAIYARLGPDRTLEWSSAGHLPPVLVTAEGARLLEGGGRPLLGITSIGPSPAAVTPLPPASTLLLYSDGLVERRGETITTGLERLVAAAAARRHLSASRLSDELIAELTPEGGLRDDVALIVLRTVGQQPDLLIDAFHSDTALLAPARARFRSWLEAQLPDKRRLDDLVLAFGEAIANAVEHGNGNDRTRAVGVEAAIRGRTLEVSVTDAGSWTQDSTGSTKEGRGRGFAIMNAVVSRVWVRPTRLGTTVSFSADLGPAAEGEPHAAA